MPRFPGPGRLVRLGLIPSRFAAPREVVVWLPPQYDGRATGRRYGAIYMHDGQNLFEPHTSFIGVDWGVPVTLSALTAAGIVEPTLVVGVWNTPLRMSEYMPDFEPVGLSQDYLRFLVEELKPLIDSRFRTQSDPWHTSTMGASMGGLISLDALCKYPHIFGGAGCISTHWPAGGGSVIGHLAQALPRPLGHRLYFDYGTLTLDAAYGPFQRRVNRIVKARGYRRGVDWLTLKFPNQDHSEIAWRERLHKPLQFLLAPRKANPPPSSKALE